VSAAPGRAAGAGERSLVTSLVVYWLPALAYIGLIFSASSIHGNRIPSIFPNMDKVAHLLEYSLLGLLLGRAVRFTLAGRGRTLASFATILCGASVGAADELYQRSVPQRSCDIRDWMVDVLAVSLAVVVTQWVSTRALRAREAAGDGKPREGSR
jgi:VanZ family protein